MASHSVKSVGLEYLWGNHQPRFTDGELFRGAAQGVPHITTETSCFVSRSFSPEKGLSSSSPKMHIIRNYSLTHSFIQQIGLGNLKILNPGPGPPEAPNLGETSLNTHGFRAGPEEGTRILKPRL